MQTLNWIPVPRWFWSALAALLLLQVHSGQGAEPPKIRIAPETTRVTEPLLADGTVDYVTALNEQMRGNITPEQNAAVLLHQAIGPKPEGCDYSLHERLARAMGVEPLPQDAPHFIRLGEPEHGFGNAIGLDEQTDQKAFQDHYLDLYDQIMEAPWVAQNHPEAVHWFEVNEQALKLVKQAVERPAYFRPIIVDEATEEQQFADLLVSALLPDIQMCREIARCLKARAMWHLGEERYQQAIADFKTLHQLAHKLCQGATLIEGLVGLALDGIAHHGDVLLLQQPQVPIKLLRQYREVLTQSPRLKFSAQSIDRAERYMALQSIQAIACRKVEPEVVRALTGTGNENDARLVALARRRDVDWNEVLTRCNTVYDSMSELLQDPGSPELLKELNTILESHTKFENFTEFRRLLSSRRKELVSGKVITEMLSETLMGVFLPAITSVKKSEMRAAANRDLIILSLSLLEFQNQTGAFPQSYRELPEEILQQISQDPFAGADFCYHLNHGTFTIYSIGMNMRDDDGQGHNDEVPGADDLVIRVAR